MAVSTQQILNGIINMQANAQQALPVIPNNGNPAGAYNMPQQSQPAPAQPASPTAGARYPWLQPSQSALNIRSLLESRRATPAQPQNTGIIPVQEQAPVMAQQLPVLPMRR